VAFEPIAPSASSEVLADIERAQVPVEAAAIVIDDFPPTQALAMPHTSAKIIPCPWATRAASCATRRVSLCAEDLPKRDTATAFKALGPTERLMSEKLVELGTRAQGGPPAGDKNLERSFNPHFRAGAS